MYMRHGFAINSATTQNIWVTIDWCFTKMKYTDILSMNTSEFDINYVTSIIDVKYFKTHSTQRFMPFKSTIDDKLFFVFSESCSKYIGMASSNMEMPMYIAICNLSNYLEQLWINKEYNRSLLQLSLNEMISSYKVIANLPDDLLFN